MSGFQILIVEDTLPYREAIENLLRANAKQIVGSRVVPEVHYATNQVEADNALQQAPPGGFDLILLDWKYPKEEDKAPEYLANLWLPRLRASQPNATIVVLTIYAHEQEDLSPAVMMLRDHDADEFIPKMTEWPKVLERLQAAMWNRARRIRQRLQTQPFESDVARTSAQDLAAALNLAHSKLHRLFNDPSNSEAGTLSKGVLQIFSELETRITGIANTLAVQENDPPSEVDCALLAKEGAAIFQGQIENRLGKKSPKGQPIVVDVKNDCRIQTYRRDLQKALTEVLQNAVDAIVEGEVYEPGSISITVERCEGEGSCAISVHDQGPGFAPAALPNLFQSAPGSSYWLHDQERHKGMGLYVARRLMHGIGGDILAGNAEEGGAEVRLIVKDWGSGK